MASRGTWSLTGGLSLYPNFEKSFVNCSGRVLVFPLVFILRATVRRRGPIKIWSGCCDVWSLRIHHPGASNFHGWSTHTTHYQCHLLGQSPFECSLGYQPPIFPSLESEVAVSSVPRFCLEVPPHLEEGQAGSPSGGRAH